MNISLHSIGFPGTLEVLEQIDRGFHRITLRAQPTAASAPCTECGMPSRRVHGVYWRSLGDVACFGHPTILLVRMRRFRCTMPTCPRRTFAEPLPGIACPRARQTDRLRAIHRSIGLALGGNPGARHAATLGVPISRTTLLDRVRADDAEPIPPVSVLGVDDWAWRKGHRYGTILCDLERRRVIDLLPDRSADTLAAWLEEHPSVSAVVRDRAGTYADGAARGAPDAIQILDRWHLLRNGSDALRGLLDQHHRELRAAARAAAQPAALAAVVEVPEPASPAERPMRTTERRSQAAQERRDARFAEVARLREQGLSLTAIARTIGIERRTVRRWLRAGHAPTWRHADRGTSILDPYKAWLDERWRSGCNNAAALWRELRDRGFAGQYTVVRDWATQRRRQDPPGDPKGAPGKPALSKSPEPPTPRRAVRLLTGEADKLSDDDRRFVTALLERSPTIAIAVDLIRRFTTMVKDQMAGALDGWLREAEGSALTSFATGLRRDEDALRAALTEPWSNGQVEGQVNRLKVIKREMYGRAGFDLLRCRVLAHA
ncbi:ISL3 family transposase (plasmid) [Skermanella sp. TT6]|uniref:ISL3 family transposase n=1 Tax=Skermanella cutis TaxID=2775420 RepID=A0ABX7BFZ7_9PROT|nr:ISL3 family transposase [Skermanella sp. TT6]QQP93326.1 ISL3 family transposase [Skermanella sp. TT6]